MAPQVEQAAAGASQDRPLRSKLIESARATWIDRLIDLSRRNNLLFYRPIQGSTIDIPTGSHALASLLQGEIVSAKDLLPDALDRPSRILNIQRKAQENLEEKGLQTLYLGVGFATWTSSDGGRDARAPVFMIPLTFKKRGRDLSSVEVQIVGEPEVNPILVHVLNTEFNVKLTSEELLTLAEPDAPQGATLHDDDAVLSEEAAHRPIDRYIAAFSVLSTRASLIPGFMTSEAAVIGNFAFAKLAMVNDLKEAASLLIGNDMIAAIAGDLSARASIGASQIEIDPHTLDSHPPDQEFCVVEADSSQQCAISGIARGQSAVVHGPPGTGKSQTITNLIATLIANGKTVLFVAEKRAALEVVQKRLMASGLDHLAMDLHGAELSSRRVMERIAHTLNTVRNAPRPHTEDVHRQFTDRRAKLNTHDQRMHTISSRSGKSVYQMQGALLRLPLDALTTLRWRGPELESLTPLRREEIHDLLREAGAFDGLLTRTDSSPWTGVSFKDGKATQEAIDAAHENLSLLEERLRSLERSTGFGRPDTLAEVSSVITILRSTEGLLELYDLNVFVTDLRPLLTELEKAKDSGLKAIWLGLTNRGFKQALKQSILLRHGTKSSAQQIRRELTEVSTVKQQWRDLGNGISLPGHYSELDGLEQSYQRCKYNVALLQLVLRETNWEALSLSILTDRVSTLAADAATPYRLLRLSEIEAKLYALGAQRLLDDIRNRKPHSALWCALFDYAWLNSTLDELAIRDPELKSFVGATHNGYVQEFKRLDSERLKAASSRICRIHAERTIQAMNKHPEQEALIKQEAAKTRRHKPLRHIFRDAYQVMTAVCPCWMASPLSVSQLIDRNASFDFVIFDEASQILPEDAIPAIMRGKHVIVAGDNKQLPPTGFFSAGADSDDDSESEAADGYESLLDMMLPFAKSFHLNWHYRSRDEALIAFSNHHIYDDRLVTFPGPGGPPAITHVLVDYIPESDGQEDSSGAEVNRVVQLAIEHAQRTPGRTLGVITMGIKHAMRVQAAMDLALRAYPELNEFFDTDRPERFFIKNLDRVQGDERDSIIMSIGYGKDRAGNLPLRFGPILSAGGRRRMNVAVTRARETMLVVSSFAHTDIDTTKVRAQTGLEFLRNYLQYAASDGKIFSHGELTDEPMNDFEADVCDALTARGMKLVPQVGCSKFRLDFGVCHPTEPGRFVLAIECDGATYHSSYTARDRDRLRQQQLENLGWVFHRIWSTDWFMRKNEEVERAWNCYQSALSNLSQKRDLSVLPNLEQPLSEQLLNKQSSPGLKSLRSSQAPPIPTRPSITEYTRPELKALYDWVQSDGLLRTHDELVDEMFAGLPFTRCGARIDAALRSTILACERIVRG